MQQHSSLSSVRPLWIARWLIVVALLVGGMVVIGGITRLTESGLSITQWKPITGIIPPLGDAQWQAEFDNYRRIPQYAAIHPGMTVAGFKWIFFWEYLHRALGRIIGLAFFVPLLWFWATRRIPRGYGWRLVALLALGGLQGALGWLMVRSGLSDRIEVAPLWLAAHLLTALFTMGGLIWTALDLIALQRNPSARPARMTMLGGSVFVLLFIQLFYGALMAGLRAGLVTDQWPLMNGKFFPGASQAGEPLALVLVADPAIVHFIHRWWAWVVLASIIALARSDKRAGARPASIAIHAIVGTQILLGIATVMAHVDIAVAALHQFVGACLVAATVWGAHAIGKRA
jgi:cytochrome c oxidase assembly protein subunit 15